jgi:PadR family transcriptional regulator, regulatory protein PadR
VAKPTVDILQGTLDMLILKAVSLGPLHGYAVMKRIEQISGGALQIPQGSLYPALARLQHGGFLKSEWGDSENNRKSKFYELSAAGRKRLLKETSDWEHSAEAIFAVLGAKSAEPKPAKG